MIRVTKKSFSYVHSLLKKTGRGVPFFKYYDFHPERTPKEKSFTQERKGASSELLSAVTRDRERKQIQKSQSVYGSSLVTYTLCHFYIKCKVGRFGKWVMTDPVCEDNGDASKSLPSWSEMRKIHG